MCVIFFKSIKLAIFHENKKAGWLIFFEITFDKFNEINFHSKLILPFFIFLFTRIVVSEFFKVTVMDDYVTVLNGKVTVGNDSRR
jgi:hypothetical protein